MLDFEDLYTELGEQLNEDITDSTALANLKRWINMGYKDFWDESDWSWKQKTGYFQTVDVYNTGTVSVTNGNKTVTGTGTTWTSAMVGRFFRVEGTEDWYEIIAVGSTTSLTLRQNYLQATASSKDYKIYKKYYYLHPDVDELIDIYVDPYPRKLTMIPAREAPNVFYGWQAGDPTKYIKYDNDRSETTYNTGTVSGTIDTKTLTGSGTSWLDNVFPGDKITIGNYTYFVLSVESDTSLTLHINLMVAVAALTTYTAKRSNLIAVEFNAAPKTYNRNIRFTYYQKSYDMQNDNDIPECPEKYLPIILEKAKAYGFGHGDDSREVQAETKYDFKVLKTKIKEKNRKSQPRRMTWMK